MLPASTQAAQLGAGLHAKLLGQSPLVGTERQIGCQHAGLAILDDLEQIDAAPIVRAHQRVVTVLIQFHGDQIEVARLHQMADGVDAGLGHMGSAEQRVVDIAHLAFDQRLAVECGIRRGRGVGQRRGTHER